MISELLDQCHARRKRRQAIIGRRMDLLDRCGASCDQPRVDLVILRLLQEKPGVGAHLCGLKHHDDKTVAPQTDDDLLLIPTTRLDPDPIDLMPLEPNR